jgi:peptidyl-prolyl cis-trans isomerase SurA
VHVAFLIFFWVLIRIKSLECKTFLYAIESKQGTLMQATRPTRVLLLSSIIAFLFIGCSKRVGNIILADIGPETITTADFERELSKNNGGWEAAKSLPMAEKEKFLDLLVKFRLKLLDAYQHGMDRDPDVVKEMQEYNSSLATSFFLDRKIIAPGIRLLYDRRKEEIRASHILFRFPPKPKPSDTLAAWQRASDVLKKARAGGDFAELAKQFSDDYVTRQKGGDLYYFSSGFMVPAFEDACFQLQPGEIYPVPVRTPFGYHVIKLTDRKPNRGQIRASHLMIRFESAAPTPEDTLKAYNAIKALQDSLRAGGDFGQLARRHSQDVGSAAVGGDLGFFERRRITQAFDAAAFSLRVGEVPGIVRTPYGYHLIRVTDEKLISSFEEMESSLRELYQKVRYRYDYENLLQRYKTTVGFKFNEDIVDTLLSCCDSTKTLADSLWDRRISSEIRQQPVFSFATEWVSLDSVISAMKKDPEFSKTRLTPEDIRSALGRVADRSLIQYRTRNIETEYPDFKRTLKEYEEGVLLYKSEQREVWDKISTNDSLLRGYYEEHRERYTTPDSVNFREIYISRDSSKALQLLDSLRAGVDFGDLAFRHTERATYRSAKGEWGFHAVGENNITEKAWTMEVGEVSGVFPDKAGYSVIEVIAKKKSRFKTFEEALPEVAGEYHDEAASRLEDEWLNRLRGEFKVSVWKDKLSDAFTGPPEKKNK